jgi:hypothetical protein
VGGALALAACGGDDPKKPASPEDQVRAAALKILESKDAKTVCTGYVTTRFIDEVYEGDRQKCIEQPLTKEDEHPGKPKVDQVRIHGANADVSVTIVGGDGDGTTGTLLFAREGRRWKLDRFGTDYLRSGFAASIRSTHSGMMSLPAMKTCLTGKAKRMRERPLRKFIYQSIRHDAKVKNTAISLAEKCPRPLAAFVAGELANGLKDRGGPAYVRCMRTKLAPMLWFTGLSGEALRAGGHDVRSAAIAGLVLPIDKECRRKG